MKRIFIDAENLLSEFELIHLKGGDDPGDSETEGDNKTEDKCGTTCTSCASCTSCESCTTCSTKVAK